MSVSVRCLHLLCVEIKLISVMIAEGPSIGKELFPRLTVCVIRLFVILVNFLFVFVKGQNVASICTSSLLTFYLQD